ncbi:MAG TPA: bifunctional phosphopantothenoylcysteine decarboxylase/phosphopantothenate--cysteine ligase CoaBC [Hyphomicrobiaceae bacterium]|nr:bifunctional phosphopantothenoylcysteine decarboxylase/phosphopantothenate--cysteine ligase CoaBC [Hyphomicrobiaceae bacterium]
MGNAAREAQVAKRIVLVIGGGIAAYKCLELIRRLRERLAVRVLAVMTRAAQEFVTPLSVGALSNEPVLTELFDLNAEREIGHIRLARDADLIVVAPATADLLAKMAGGHADDLASALLLATDKPVLAAPAMNPHMWSKPATRRNVAQLRADGIHFIGPETGEMAERGEAGPGRLAEVPQLIEAIEALLGVSSRRPAGEGPLAGRHVLVTSGPTHEPIDPVRYIANRSSGKQGAAIAAEAARLGARVTLVTGPVSAAPLAGVDVIKVETATEMLETVCAALPADIAVFAAAVADWRVARASDQKLKKRGKEAPRLELVENADISKVVGMAPIGERPPLVIAFAAETENVVEHAKAKRKAKGANWVVANDVSPATGIMGGDRNTVHLVTAEGVDSWPDLDKAEVAERLMARAAEWLAENTATA